jgi:TusA-related sulfurtransferase
MEITMNCLDFRGEECPGPLVKTIRVLSKLRKGEKLMVLTTSKDCVEMLKQTIEVFGIAKIEVYNVDNYYKIYLEKTVDNLEV